MSKSCPVSTLDIDWWPLISTHFHAFPPFIVHYYSHYSPLPHYTTGSPIHFTVEAQSNRHLPQCINVYIT